MSETFEIPPQDVIALDICDMDAVSGEEAERIGLNLIRDLSGDITYVRSLETNNTIVRFCHTDRMVPG